jgi:hypothetical protein
MAAETAYMHGRAMERRASAASVFFSRLGERCRHDPYSQASCKGDPSHGSRPMALGVPGHCHASISVSLWCVG